MPTQRRKTRLVKVGEIAIGEQAPISVQSMTTTDTRDIEGTLGQIRQLVQEGCEIVRLAVPDQQAAQALKALCERVQVPLVADIHFDYRLALQALEAGVSGLRINPGNIGDDSRVRQVALAARDRRIPIRIGVNGGSLEKEILSRHGGVTAAGMAESALKQAALLEEMGHGDIVLSLKASNVPLMIEANRLVASKCDYPLHLGVTEAGMDLAGIVRSAVGLGVLLQEGIGDTIRVSLTGDPVQEVKAGFEILKALGLRQRGPVIISCPTCGRCQIDLIGLARQVKEAVQDLTAPLTIAVMGCTVNGPGEAAEADFGVAGGRGSGVIFRHGKIVGKAAEDELAAALLQEIMGSFGDTNKVQ